jgi:FKBP-type peptidyl-prolyl cis-trans isomerase FkpA
MNKKSFFILVLAALPFLFGSCVKSDVEEKKCLTNSSGIPTAAEIASLQNYLNSNSITATQHPGGFFYIVVVQGTGPTPNANSVVTFKYTGKLENGTIFDQSQSGYTSPLSQLILGFQRGLPIIQKGGFIKLFLPPSLGYGCSQTGNIPPGSNLIFDVELTNVQ